MKDVTNIPKGYKISSLGIIPEEWEIKILGCAFRVQGGYAFKSGDYKNIGIPIVRISNLPQDSQYVNLEDCVYCDIKQGIPEQFLINRYDLLIAMSGATTGKIAIYVGDGGAYLNQRVGVFKTKSSDIIYQYLPFLLSSDIYENQLKSLLIAGAQPNVAPTDIESLRFPIPSKEEQQRIVSVLQLWDTAIEKQTALIEKLKLRKRGLMQQLLTGKKRLHGFTEPWKEVRFGEILHRISNGLTYDPTNNQGFKVTRIETISDGKIDINKVGFTDIKPTDDFKIQKGDILYSHINSLAHIGKVAYFDIDETIYHGMNLLVLRTKQDFCSKFLYYLMLMDSAKKNALKYAKPAVNQASINISDIKCFKLKIPLLIEQRAIVAILDEVDKQIELSNKKLMRLQEEKRGLMQVLLTGKKRILNL